MNGKEYEKLQARLTALQNKKERQPGSGSSWKDGWRDAILAVKSLLHAEFKAADPEWIPFTKREPDTGAHVLITVEFPDKYVEVTEIDWGVLSYSVRNGKANGLDMFIYRHATAWMPMPEPYKKTKLIREFTYQEEE